MVKSLSLLSTIHATHIGTATLLLEIAGVRILTDPVLGVAGESYGFGFGTRSLHTETPALTAAQIGSVDVVLLSHDQHGDNLDNAGRAYIQHIPHVVTTVVAHRRLGHHGSIGLKSFAQTNVCGLTITATPARHGPPCSLPFVGPVVGFVIEHPTLPAPVYISGDTVWFRGIREVARLFRPAISFLHLGSVRFPISGGIRYTFDAREATVASAALGSSTIVPIHYAGWTHFRETRAQAEHIFSQTTLAPRVRWIELGVRTALDITAHSAHR